MWQGCKPSNGTKLFLQNICFITYDMAQLLWMISNVPTYEYFVHVYEFI